MFVQTLLLLLYTAWNTNMMLYQPSPSLAILKTRFRDYRILFKQIRANKKSVIPKSLISPKVLFMFGIKNQSRCFFLSPVVNVQSKIVPRITSVVKLHHVHVKSFAATPRPIFLLKSFESTTVIIFSALLLFEIVNSMPQQNPVYHHVLWFSNTIIWSQVHFLPKLVFPILRAVL